MSVQLETSDGEIFTVPVEVAKMSVTIAHMLEDVDLISDDPDDAGSPIPLPNINSATLAKVLDYCRWHHANPNAAERGADGVLEWDRKFCEVERVILYHLILAAVHPPPMHQNQHLFSLPFDVQSPPCPELLGYKTASRARLYVARCALLAVPTLG
jgi:hypothetical protein